MKIHKLLLTASTIVVLGVFNTGNVFAAHDSGSGDSRSSGYSTNKQQERNEEKGKPTYERWGKFDKKKLTMEGQMQKIYVSMEKMLQAMKWSQNNMNKMEKFAKDKEIKKLLKKMNNEIETTSKDMQNIHKSMLEVKTLMSNNKQ